MGVTARGEGSHSDGVGHCTLSGRYRNCGMRNNRVGRTTSTAGSVAKYLSKGNDPSSSASPSEVSPDLHSSPLVPPRSTFLHLKRVQHIRRRSITVTAPASAHPPLPISFGRSLMLLVCFLGCAAQAKSTDNGEGGISVKDSRITCYTCVNVSNNYECNRFAIDRPCPEGGDYCLTLHVMDAVDRERSVLVNKRCASLDDCTGDATGCTTAFGQTQCVSCCDQPYCNDSVPSNSTNAIFYRSAASSLLARKRQLVIAWTVAAMVTLPFVKAIVLGGAS